MNADDFFDDKGCVVCKKKKTRRLSPLGRTMHLKLCHPKVAKKDEDDRYRDLGLPTRVLNRRKPLFK